MLSPAWTPKWNSRPTRRHRSTQQASQCAELSNEQAISDFDGCVRSRAGRGVAGTGARPWPVSAGRGKDRGLDSATYSVGRPGLAGNVDERLLRVTRPTTQSPPQPTRRRCAEPRSGRRSGALVRSKTDYV